MDSIRLAAHRIVAFQAVSRLAQATIEHAPQATLDRLTDKAAFQLQRLSEAREQFNAERQQ